MPFFDYSTERRRVKSHPVMVQMLSPRSALGPADAQLACHSILKLSSLLLFLPFPASRISFLGISWSSVDFLKSTVWVASGLLVTSSSRLLVTRLNHYRVYKSLNFPQVNIAHFMSPQFIITHFFASQFNHYTFFSLLNCTLHIFLFPLSFTLFVY